MGARGRTALAEFLLGSTVTRVVHLARVPVLLVK
jgi:nucleotide-binding universal stress UspA family protein